MTKSIEIQNRLNNLLASKDVFTYVVESMWKNADGKWELTDVVAAEFKPLPTSEDPIEFDFVVEAMDVDDVASQLRCLLNSFENGLGSQHTETAESYTENMQLQPSEVEELERFAKGIK